jgi:hypothetical protein
MPVSIRPRDLTERAMEVDLRLPSPPSSSACQLSSFTACANERATRVQTALDKYNFDSPTKWESMAASGGVQDDDAHDDDKNEAADWSYLLSLALSRREQASQKLKEIDDQLQVCNCSVVFVYAIARACTRSLGYAGLPGGAAAAAPLQISTHASPRARQCRS